MTDDIRVVRSPSFLEHAFAGEHPERPERLLAVHELFEPGAPFADLPQATLRPADPEELRRGHAAELIQRVLAVRGEAGWFDPDTYYVPRSADTALLAAGSTIELALAIARGEVRRGFSLVRPPGHHATPGRIMGFCLFNNVALAAAAVRHAHPQSRVAVVDFDLHHGNGTQDLFYGDPDVLFVSSHRFPFYPGTGAAEERGTGRGKGTTLNFPLGRPYGGDFFLRLYGEVALPLVDRFAPDYLIVSAGFDGHEADPMDGFRIPTADYGRLAEQLVALAEQRGGKILFCLEGGYDPAALRDSVAEVLTVLRNAPRRPFAPAPPPGSAEGEGELERFERLFRGN